MIYKHFIFFSQFVKKNISAKLKSSRITKGTEKMTREDIRNMLCDEIGNRCHYHIIMQLNFEKCIEQADEMANGNEFCSTSEYIDFAATIYETLLLERDSYL